MSLFELLEKIVAAEEEKVTLRLPEEKINLLSLKILKREAERRGKDLKLKAKGPKAKRLITILEEGVKPEPVIIKGRFKLPRIHLDLIFLRRLGLIPLLLFGILLFLGGGVYWLLNFFPRAEVVLTLKPIPMVKEISVTASTAAEEIDAEENIIPGTKISVEVEDQKSTPATGKATVGEKAKGTITFVNCTNIAVTFTAGTVMEAEGGDLTYTIDANVVDVPKKPDPATCGTKPGDITASQIGEKYNQSVGVKFDFVGGYSNLSYDAYITSGQSVTGGSSEEVTVVSSADQAKVLEELKEELVGKGKADLEEEAGLDQVVIQKAIKQEVVEETFLQEVGEEAEEVSLTLRMKFTTIVYKEEDLQDLISQVFGELIPENYELYPGEMEIETIGPKLSKENLDFSAKVTAQVIPKLDLEEIKNNLVGRNLASAQEYLGALSNITAYELRLYPNLPENLRRVPRNTERIRIELQAETEEEL